MLEAQIVRAEIVANRSGQTVLLAVAEYGETRVNIRVPFEFETLDRERFLEDLRETLAQDFDLPVYRVDVKGEELLEKMRMGALMLKFNMVRH